MLSTYLYFKLIVLILSLPTQDIPWDANFDWVLEVIWICSQGTTDHPLSCTYQTGRRKKTKITTQGKKENNFTENENVSLVRGAGKEEVEITSKIKELFENKVDLVL